MHVGDYKEARETGMVFALGFLAGVALLVQFPGIVWELERAWGKRAAMRIAHAGQPVVDAMLAYKAGNGRFAPSLDLLAPKYLGSDQIEKWELHHFEGEWSLHWKGQEANVAYVAYRWLDSAATEVGGWEFHVDRDHNERLFGKRRFPLGFWVELAITGGLVVAFLVVFGRFVLRRGEPAQVCDES